MNTFFMHNLHGSELCEQIQLFYLGQKLDEGISSRLSMVY